VPRFVDFTQNPTSSRRISISNRRRSSRINNRGSCMLARASYRRFIPPDSPREIAVAFVPHAAAASYCSARSFARGEVSVRTPAWFHTTMVTAFSNMCKFISCGTCRMARPCGLELPVDVRARMTLAAPPDFVDGGRHIPISVVLPAPLGPSSAKKSPVRQSRSTPFRPGRRSCTSSSVTDRKCFSVGVDNQFRANTARDTTARRFPFGGFESPPVSPAIPVPAARQIPRDRSSLGRYRSERILCVFDIPASARSRTASSRRGELLH